MAPRMAFLGLGSMGEAITSNLVKHAGLTEPILLWNRTNEKAAIHAATLGAAKAVTTIEEAVAGADIIWSCLATETAVLEVYAAIVKTPRPGKLFVECSTISAEATSKLTDEVLASEAEFVAMPVFGEPSMARARLLTCLPAGQAPSVKKILPFLKGVIGKAVIDLSDQRPEVALQLKLVGNVLIVQMIESVAEAHLLAEKIGMPAQNVHQMIDSVWSGPFSIYSERMLSGGYYQREPIVDVSMAKHVADHVLTLADSCGAKLPAYREGVKHLQGVEKYAGKNKDISGIYGSVRQESGLPYEA